MLRGVVAVSLSHVFGALVFLATLLALSLLRATWRCGRADFE